MKSRRSITESDKLEEVNISPLIDMVFILLIFFIVTTVFVEEPGVDVSRPRAASGEQLDKNSILIAITGDDQVIYGGSNIGVGGIRPLVKRLTRQDPMPVILQVDAAALAETVAKALDAAQLGGALRIDIATDKG
ncbi:MAG: ExbD/TolR family protein [Verrucomicrobiia bacterium]|jgi:biopolymer transport protein ExbD